MIRVQRPFYFRGRIPLSKSWLNRALILRSIHNQVRILDWDPSEQDGADVLALEHALRDLAGGTKSFFIGESGTGLRFLLARLSIERGSFTVRGTEKLMSRPLKELIRVLRLLGCTVEMKSSQELSVISNGWPDTVTAIDVATEETSQFASALILAASHRPAGLNVNYQNPVSAGYIEMTVDLVNQVTKLGRRVLVPEIDASSSATLAAIVIAADRKENLIFVRNEVHFLGDQIEKTKQPDRVFFDLIRSLCGDALTDVVMSGSDGSVKDQTPAKLEYDLRAAPDLFPILAALGALQPGGVRIFGAPHLRHKESDRISEVTKLLRQIGLTVQENPDGIEISSISLDVRNQWRQRTKLGLPFVFQPPADHRLAFAAGVLAAGGVPIEFLGRGMVEKSFPAFWSILEGDAPKVALIGHRGTGKTEAAKRWAHLLGARATAVDLDREVERLCGRSVRQLFEEDGEGEFRWYEKKAFREADDESRRRVGAFLVACGAGFDTEKIDSSWLKVWLRRPTDQDGRIFFGRPRLDPEVSPIDEGKKRFKERDPKFQMAADRIFDLAEGESDPSEQLWVRDLFDDDSISAIGGAISLLPEMNIGAALERYLRWGVARIEIRDDLFPHQLFSLVWDRLTEIPSNRLLISFRDSKQEEATLNFLERIIRHPSFIGTTIDYPFESAKELPPRLRQLMEIPGVDLVASWHGSFAELKLNELVELEAKLHSSLATISRPPRLVMKLAAQVNDFSQLRELHQWVVQSPATRVLLPMSPIGTRARWAWYRLLRGSQTPMGLAFWRDGDGSSVDQPTFSQWWRRERFVDTSQFAAVIGDPIHHSRTPLEQDSFFTSLGIPIYAIAFSRDEAEVAISILVELGLVAAAVTSPLKEVVAKPLGISSNNALNTLALEKGKWVGASTDGLGFAALWKEAKETFPQINFLGDVVLWGGGGIKSSVLQVVPAIRAFRASLGDEELAGHASGPEIVVWASGSNRGKWPANWRPKLILDLSYTDDSAGRNLAIEVGAKYISGLTMFRIQAEHQRTFWRERLS